MIIPNIWTNKIHVPNHQPVGDLEGDFLFQHVAMVLLGKI